MRWRRYDEYCNFEILHELHHDYDSSELFCRRQWTTQISYWGGHWGLRYCGIAPFFLRYFGNFNLELRYCGIFWSCGMRFFSILGVSKIIVKVLLRFPSFFYPPRLFRKQAKTECQTSSVTRVIIWNVIVSDYEQYQSTNNFNVSSANYNSQPRGLALTWRLISFNI